MNIPDGYFERRIRVNQISQAILEALPPNQLYDELFEALLGVATSLLHSQIKEANEEKDMKPLIRDFLIKPEIWAHPDTLALWDALNLQIDEEGDKNDTTVEGW